jgi:hypothetical protein
MKKILLVFAFVFFLIFPVFPGGETGLNSTLLSIQDWGRWALEKTYYIQQAEDMVMSIKHLYDQLEHLKRTEERYMKNLKSIMDARSFSDFMGWFNRSLYITQEAERIYNGMGVKIGGKNYGLTDIDEIPDALRNEFVDRHSGDLTEEEKYRVWTRLGLAPSNYFYLKTWQNRSEEIKKRFIAAREMHADELEEAADRNNAILAEYSEESEDIDSNKIAKNSHATQMQIEMVLRDLSLSVDDLKDYIATRDQADKILPNPMMPSENWNRSSFSPITNGKTKERFEN